MRPLTIAVICIALGGCATYRPTSSGYSSPPAHANSAQFPAGASTPSPNPAGSAPQFVVPVSGGVIVAMPLGGNLFLPLEGGPPVVGIATGP